MLSDPETTRYMHFATFSDVERRQWFDRCVANEHQPDDDEDALYWAIARKNSGHTIGWFGIGTSSYAAVPGERSFEYLLNRAYWNRGLMTEALRGVLASEFGARGTPRLRVTCNVANLASARVMEKAGMDREKTVFDTDFEGNWVQQHHYTITKAEYEVQS